MKVSVFVLTVLAVLACGEARVPRDAPAESNQPIQLADLITQAQTNINELGKQIQQQLNLPDQETVVNTIKNQSSTLVNNVQSYISKVSEEVKTKSPELEKLWNDVKDKFSKAVEDVNAQIPDAKQQAAQLQAKFQEGVQTLVQESDKAAKAISQNSGKVQEDFAKLTKQAVEIAVQAAEGLNKQLQQAAATKSTK